MCWLCLARCVLLVVGVVASRCVGCWLLNVFLRSLFVVGCWLLIVVFGVVRHCLWLVAFLVVSCCFLLLLGVCRSSVSLVIESRCLLMFDVALLLFVVVWCYLFLFFVVFLCRVVLFRVLFSFVVYIMFLVCCYSFVMFFVDCCCLL